MAITPPPDRDMQQIIEDMLRRLRGLENGSQLAAGVTISQGGLTVVDPNTGTTIFRLGLYPLNDGSGRKQMVLFLYRNDGSIVQAMWDGNTTDGHPFQQALQWFDRNGDTVFSDDTTSGQGIARPYIPMGAFVDALVPTATTTNTTFTLLQSLVGVKQHPKVQGQILVYADSGTTGTIELVDQDGNVLFTTNLTSGQFGYLSYGPVALAGEHEKAISLNIQGKVLTGAGKVGARGVSALGIQS